MSFSVILCHSLSFFVILCHSVSFCVNLCILDTAHWIPYSKKPSIAGADTMIDVSAKSGTRIQLYWTGLGCQQGKSYKIVISKDALVWQSKRTLNLFVNLGEVTLLSLRTAQLWYWIPIAKEKWHGRNLQMRTHGPTKKFWIELICRGSPLV